MYRILKFFVSSFRQDSVFLMDGSTVRGMGVTLPIIIEGTSIIELWWGVPSSLLHYSVYSII